MKGVVKVEEKTVKSNEKKELECKKKKQIKVTK